MLKPVIRPGLTALLLTTLLAPVAGRAQTTRLTLEEVLDRVDSVNLSVLVNREFVNQAEENVTIARSPFLPFVSGSASQSRGRRGVTSTIGGATRNFFQGGFSAGLTVLDLRQWRTLKAAREGVAVSRYEYEDAIQTVMAQVASAYFAHVRDIAFDKVIDSNIERAEVLLNLARNQLRAGVATQIDVTRAEAELVAQQQAKLQQESVIVNSGLQLKQLLNLDLDADLVLEDFRVRRELDPTVLNLTLDDILPHRPDYEAALAALQQAHLQTGAARAGRLPTVDVSGSMSWQGDTPADDLEDSWTAAVQLNVPIFEGRRIRADERIAESRERQQELQIENLRNLIGSELRNALEQVRSQLAQIDVAEKNLTLAEEELRLARVRYEQGVADNRELIDAENRYAQANFNLVSALYLYHVARVELARVRGNVRLILAEKVP